METGDIWGEVLKLVQTELPPQTYEKWFGPTRMLSSSETSITIGVPNAFFENWLKEHYTESIARALEKITPKKINIEFVTTAPPPQPEVRVEKSPLCPRQKIYLNPRYTFESFVVGPSNRFTHAASLAVAESPSRAYNPLFIYGKAGLGKTHLMQAVGHFAMRKQPGLKLLYISTEKFTNQLITAIQHRTTAKFREQYRTLDIILIDDIHFIAGKESTQEEFFHTFNSLYDAHKQIVISSDRPPKDIPTLEDRLVSRFEWGLVADIQPPDLETRIAILRKKAEREAIAIPDEVINFIAEKIKSNIRELEGALIRIVAYGALEGKKLNVDLAQDVLKGLLRENERSITVDVIQKVVAEYFNIPLSDMQAKRRSRDVAYPRQIAMYLVRDLTDHSLPEIGASFGGRDHTTVLHACDKIQKELKKDQNVKTLLNKLISEIKE